MSVENPLWGAARIHGDLLKLSFAITVHGFWFDWTLNASSMGQRACACTSNSFLLVRCGIGSTRWFYVGAMLREVVPIVNPIRWPLIENRAMLLLDV
jgi:hypothetical protein